MACLLICRKDGRRCFPRSNKRDKNRHTHTHALEVSLGNTGSSRVYCCMSALFWKTHTRAHSHTVTRLAKLANNRRRTFAQAEHQQGLSPGMTTIWAGPRRRKAPPVCQGGRCTIEPEDMRVRVRPPGSAGFIRGVEWNENRTFWPRFVVLVVVRPRAVRG